MGRRIYLFKFYTATVCFGYPIAFFLAPHGWFQLSIAYGLIGVLVIIFNLWFSALRRGQKVLWTVALVVFNVISLPIYWVVVIKNKSEISIEKARSPKDKIAGNCRAENYSEESIACGLLSIGLGPFGFLPGIVLAHCAHNNLDDALSQTLKRKMVLGFSLNYGLSVIWLFLILSAVRDFLRPL